MPVEISALRVYGAPPSATGDVTAPTAPAAAQAVAPAVDAGGAVTHGRDVDASNTGIAGIGVSEASLTTQGGQTFSTPGQTITGIKFTGTVTLAADNITLSGCMVETSGESTRAVRVTGNNCTVEDCTITAPSGQSAYMGVSTAGDGVTVSRCDISRCENAVTIESSNCVVEDSYLHTPSNASSPQGHVDMIEVYGGDNTVIQRCMILGLDTNITTADVNIAPWWGATSCDNTLMQDNYMDGANAIILVDLQSTGAITNTRVLRNDFRGYQNSVLGRYAALYDVDGRGTVETEAALASNTAAILWPTSGGDENYWADCQGLSPDRTGEVVAP